MCIHLLNSPTSCTLIQFTQLHSRSQTPYSQALRCMCPTGLARIYVTYSVKEDKHRLSHRNGISCVILHWQWQTALDRSFMPNRGYESYLGPSTYYRGVLVLYSLATSAFTHFRQLIYLLSVFLHFEFLRLWSASSWTNRKRNVICDVLNLPAMSSCQMEKGPLRSSSLQGFRQTSCLCYRVQVFLV